MAGLHHFSYIVVIPHLIIITPIHSPLGVFSIGIKALDSIFSFNHLREILLLITSLTFSFAIHTSYIAKGIKTPPKFHGLNFLIWKVKMTVFLQFLGSRVAKAVTKPFNVPVSDEDT